MDVSKSEVEMGKMRRRQEKRRWEQDKREEEEMKEAKKEAKHLEGVLEATLTGARGKGSGRNSRGAA